MTKFYQRSPIQYPPIIAGGTIENGDPEDRMNWLKMLVGYMPEFPNDLGNPQENPILPSGVNRTDAGKPINDERLRERFAIDAINGFFTGDIIQDSVNVLET